MAAGTGYIQEFNSQPNDKIDADLFNDEYGLLNTAFDSNDGHLHDGTDGNGAFISLLSDIQNLNTIHINQDDNEIIFSSAVGPSANPELRLRHQELLPATTNGIDLGNHTNRFRDLRVQGTGYFGTLEVGFTDSEVPEVPGELIAINTIDNDPTMTNNSATALVTQNSIKSYVDNEVTNSIGIFSRSEYTQRASDQASSGTLTPYITITMTNVQTLSNIHVHAMISAEALANNTSPGNMLCMVRRNGGPLLTREASIVYTTDTVNTLLGTTTMIFRDDDVPAGDHVYTLEFREQNLAGGKAVSGTLLLLEELVSSGGVQ